MVKTIVKQRDNACVGAKANRGQWEQGCRLCMATDLGPVRATLEKKKNLWVSTKSIHWNL